jgi:hypothetical protein
MPPNPDRRVVGVIILVASLIAAVSARPHAGSFNDGSRLATVDSLVDRGTLAIDDSIFVRPPPLDSPPGKLPYAPLSWSWMAVHGTYDKVLVRGHFYSDKPPIQSLLLAGVYQVAKVLFGLDARENTALFVYLMTLASSGLSYVISVVFAYRMGRILSLPVGQAVLLCASLGLATVALPYTRQVNGHIALLGVTIPIFERLAALGAKGETPGLTAALLLGTLTGLAYALDQPTGALLIAGTGGVLFLRRPGVKLPLLVLAGALPWVVVHQAVIYSISGGFVPLGQVPAYFDYPDAAFDESNMTGRWLHETPWDFMVYAAGLLFGSQGFLLSNLPLLLAVPAVPFLFRRLPRSRPELLFAVGLSVGTWLVYAALSNNYSGFCCSIRWFVPLLAPGFFVLALLLREYPRWFRPFLILSAWGMILTGLMWWIGPWDSDVPFFWPILAAAVVTVLVSLWARR